MALLQRPRSLEFGFRVSSDMLGDSLSERVYKGMKRDIVAGVFAHGIPMSEKELAVRYKASRTPVREAALRLQNENLLRIIPKRGYFVPEITLSFMNEFYEYRVVLESTCAELAAKKEPDKRMLEKLDQLAQTHYRSEDPNSYSKFIEADTTFHIGIAQLTKNQLLVRAVADARSQMERIMYAAMDIDYYGELPTHEHLQILKAIRKRNSQSARKLMHDHIIGSRDKVLTLAAAAPRLI